MDAGNNVDFVASENHFVSVSRRTDSVRMFGNAKLISCSEKLC